MFSATTFVVEAGDKNNCDNGRDVNLSLILTFVFVCDVFVFAVMYVTYVSCL